MDDRRLGSRSGEEGVALLYAIVAMVIVSGLVVALSTLSEDTLTRAKERSQRVANLPTIESAIAKYQQALDSNQAHDRNDFVLNLATMNDLLNDPTPPVAGDKVVPNSSSEIPEPYRTVAGVYDIHGAVKTVTPMPSNARYTMREKLFLGTGATGCTSIGLPASLCTSSEALLGYWQVYRIDLPDYSGNNSNGHLVVYFRTWIATPDTSATKFYSKARTVRVEFRPGRFADYQLISDGPIRFESKGTITGPVHSNGFDNMLLGSPPASVRIFGGPLSCGPDASFSTAQGTIGVSGCATTPQDEKNNKFISFLRTEQSFRQIQEDYNDGKAGVHVFDDYWDGAYGFYRVKLHENKVEVHAPIWGTYNVPTDSSGSNYFACMSFYSTSCFKALTPTPINKRYTALLFRDDVVIEGGSSTGRVTIAAHNPEKQAGTADIFIEGDIQTKPVVNDPDPAKRVYNPKDTLGLLAQGNVVVQQALTGSDPCKVNAIRAAMVASSGTVTIPPSSVTDVVQPQAPHCNGAITVRGSIAAHHQPILRIDWPSGKKAGYESRRYIWDQYFRTNTPPYFPLTNEWQVVGYREANADCLFGGREKDPTCR